MAQGHTSDEASGSGNNDLDAMVDYMNNHLPDYVFTIMRNRSPTHFNFPMLRPRHEGCHKDSLHMACPGMACHYFKSRLPKWCHRFYVIGLLKTLAFPLDNGMLHEKLTNVCEKIKIETTPVRDYMTFLGLKPDVDWDIL